MKAENIEDIYALSPTQQGLLFHALYSPNSGVYCDQYNFTLHGNLNRSAFEKAWQKVVDRHAVLRTSFYWEELEKPLQVVHRSAKLPLEFLDWRLISPDVQQEKLEAFLQADILRGFELSLAPLMRFTLIQVGEDTYQCVWTNLHLILDGWSRSLLVKEVFDFYKAFCQGQEYHLNPPRPYRNYIAWLQQQDLSQAERFWRQTLKGVQTPTSLGVKKTVSNSSEEESYDERQIELSETTTAALQSFARENQLTLNTLVQGAWALLLSRYSGEEDAIFGALSSGRPATLEGSESAIGVFVNTLPMRVLCASEESLVPWLKKLQALQVEARQYEYCPLVEIQGWSEVPRGLPLFESLVVFENYPVESDAEESTNLEIRDLRVINRTNYPLTLIAGPGSKLSLKIIYDRRYFDGYAIARMLGHLSTLLSGMVTANSNQCLKDVPLLTEAERQQLLVEWNNTKTEFPQDRCIHQLFEEQVERTPDAVAVVFEDQQLTYRQLNQRANQLAHHLRSLGVGTEVLVGICLERSIEMIIALLGILKAGGAYVPLDPAYPPDRLAFMLSDAKVSVLVTQARLLESLPYRVRRAVCVDNASGSSAIASQSQENLASAVTPNNRAYVIYTSGSTGKPKGVQILHRAVVNFLSSMSVSLRITSRDVLLAVTTLSFDIAALEIYLPLIVGAKIAIASREVAADGIRLSQLLSDSGATVMQATPATWRLLLAAGWLGNKPLKILVGGEALSRELADKLRENCCSELWNLYGPTETTIWSTVCNLVESDNNSVSIGRPIANTQIYVFDEHLMPVPIGVPGELHIGGMGLSCGYLNRPELSAEKFIPDSFSNEPNARLYKTGDRARYLPDGNIEYLGRIDNQVKIRGFRIELGEIDALLNQHPAVRESVAVVREDKPGEKRLVAYAVPNKEQTPKISELQDFLKNKLPEYMVPNAFVVLEVLPLTPNGKVDRRALPAPDAPDREELFVAPETPVEDVLTGIFARVLGIDRVGVNDNFFNLGGHSLLATQVISWVREAFRVELSVRCLFEAPTVAQLSDRVETAMRAGLGLEAPPIVRVSRSGNLPLSFAQQRLWFIERLEPGLPLYNLPIAVRLTGSLNVAALEQTFNELLRRHEALRTTFTTVEGQPVQRIAPTLTLVLPVVDWRELPESDRSAEVLRLAAEEAQQPFDLERGPLLRNTLVQLSETEYVMLFTMHHIVSDGWSMGVLIREVAALYEAFSAGKRSPLPELPIQYADFAVWQRQWLQGNVLQTQLDYWKQQLSGAPAAIKLPTDRPRRSIQTYQGAKRYFVIPKPLKEALTDLSHREGATLFMTLLAAFNTLLYSYAGQEDILVGSPIAYRNWANLEGLIGFFINTLVLRTDLSNNPSFQELLSRVRRVTLEAYAHQDLPFDKLVEELKPERNPSYNPLFQVWFVLQNAPMSALELPNLTLSPLPTHSRTARHELKLSLMETSEGINGEFEYKTDLFDAATIDKMAEHFEALLNQIATEPNTKLSALAELLAAAQRQHQTIQEKELEKASRQKFQMTKRKAIRL